MISPCNQKRQADKSFVNLKAMGKKKFNITGTCYPDLHYMMDNRSKLEAIQTMVEEGSYFVINRPRQYGKTTLLALLAERLSVASGYLPIEVNFQGVDSHWYASDSAFATMVARQMQKALSYAIPEQEALLQQLADVGRMEGLSDAITVIVQQLDKKIVLIIDEVDASSQHEPFLSFLGMLRSKYLLRFKPMHATFHSVVLAGVHDIKTLKSKLRGEHVEQYNSPWNIAADFTVDLSFSPEEIRPMLVSYAEAEGVKLDTMFFAQRLHDLTGGHPFLISKLCKLIAETVLPKSHRDAWSAEDLEKAIQLLLNENNTNFDSLIKNLENNPDLYNLVYEVIVNGVEITFNPHEPVISHGRLYGILRDNGRVKIHNPIYEQVIYNYMTARTFQTHLQTKQADFPTRFETEDGRLDMKAVLLKFQDYMREQYSGKDQPFLEREWRLVFLAFLKPIINGKGYDFKEPQVSEEKRLDIVVTYRQYKYVIELKRWYGPKRHEEGVLQLVDYLNRQAVSEGYLIVFEHQGEKSWRQEDIELAGKQIFTVWI